MTDSKKNYKKFVKGVKDACNSFTGKYKKSKKQCLDAYMSNWTNCSKEYSDWTDSMLTDEQRKSCENKDYDKQDKCLEEIRKKQDTENKYARYNHCVANKCPESGKMTKQITHKLRDELIKQSRKNCNACDTEINQAIKTDDTADNINDCYKKFDKFTPQTNCISKIYKKSMKSKAKYRDCIMKKCSKASKK